MRNLIAVLIVTLFALSSYAETRTVYLDELNLGMIKQGWGEARARESVLKKTLRLNETKYKRGVGSHAPGRFHVALDGKTTKFRAVVGVDDHVGKKGSVSAAFYCDGKKVYSTGALKGAGKPARVNLDLTGVRLLSVVMKSGDDGNSFDHFDWANARFTCKGANPVLVGRPDEEAIILTPKPAPAPRINGAKVFGIRPGSPFLFRMAVTGERPMRFSVDSLPAGLAVDEASGIISGVIEDRAPQTYKTLVRAENAAGKAEREFRIVVGDTLALTPPMGWNDWYAHYDRITQAMMCEAADIMVSTGMADVGYQYVNIDDCWMNTEKHADPKRVGPARDDNGDILPNAYFPDMKGLADYIHAKGLKAGLYTSPGPKTCAGCTGTWGYEEQDAKKFADWGYDFLKYDWCSYRRNAGDHSLEELKKPYFLISAALRKQNRDILLNLCQYGMGQVWKWGEEVGGHCWRTAGDLGFELEQYHDVARRNAEYWPHAHPGAWNDPDYLQIGSVGNAAQMGKPIPCPLTPNEQYSYMSLWCLMAAPLFYSGDMASLSEFTLNVLCNPEVIEVNQDPLGVQGRPMIIRSEEDVEIWTKPMEDGSLAVGMFNLSEIAQDVTVAWSELEVKGTPTVRDLWRQKDLGPIKDKYTATIPRHGVQLVRLSFPS